MGEFLTALVAIFVLTIVFAVIYIMFFKKSSTSGSVNPDPKPNPIPYSEQNRTVVKRRALFQLKVHSTGKVYTIENIPEDGLLVGSPDGREEYLTPDQKTNKLSLVSGYNHLSRKSFTIGKDDDGMFINPHPECKNKVALSFEGDPVNKSIPLENGLSIYIGDEKITFCKPTGKPLEKDEPKTKIIRIR